MFSLVFLSSLLEFSNCATWPTETPEWKSVPSARQTFPTDSPAWPKRPTRSSGLPFGAKIALAVVVPAIVICVVVIIIVRIVKRKKTKGYNFIPSETEEFSEFK